MIYLLYFIIIALGIRLAPGLEVGVAGTSSLSFVSSDLLKSFRIGVVLSDVDGTLLNDDHKISQWTIDSVRALKQTGMPFFIATGRPRKSMVEVTGPQFLEVLGGSADEIPGVFSQGIEVYGEKGVLIHSEHLEQDVVNKAIDFAKVHNVGLIAAVGDRLLCDKYTEVVQRIENYAVPFPEMYEPGLRHLNDFNLQVKTLLLLQEEELLQSIRSELDSLVSEHARITTSMKGMMEVLPLGISKGEGVKILLNHYNMSLDSAIAFGDAENDVEMIQSVKLGIAVANASPLVKKVAGAITSSNNDNGVAEVLDMIVQNQTRLLSEAA